MTTPVDFSKNDIILAKWSKSVNIDSLVDVMGHFDGPILDYVFHMRNPPKFITDKYIKLV